MKRPCRQLYWHYLGKPALGVSAVGFILYFGDLTYPHSLPLIAFLIGLVLHCRQAGWIFRFDRATRSFLSYGTPQIVIWHDPELAGWRGLPHITHCVEEELCRLADWFGRPLKGPVTVFLFPGHASVAQVFGPAYGGTALVPMNAVVVARSDGLTEDLRHELAHLFLERWNPHALPLLSEGIPTCLQWHPESQYIDAAVRALFQQDDLPPVRKLVSSSYFFAVERRRVSYAMAGSFCGFLIRRFGKEKVLQLYRRCDEYFFPIAFRLALGMSLNEADQEWRRELYEGRRLKWRAA